MRRLTTSSNSFTPHMISRFISINIIAIIAAAAVVLTGCESVCYYGQVVKGQIDILNKRQPIAKLLAEPQTSEALKVQLRWILNIREFAKARLDLPVNGHYLDFVDVERPFAVWNIFVAPEFSLALKKWCYPVIGCMSYRGYFVKESAVNYANRLRAQGYDVFLSGVAAYSTLGWFDDPVLNTFVYRKETQLAALIFHELAHQLVYVPNDTTFNESFATFVEQEALHRWLHDIGIPGAFIEYEAERLRRRDFVQLVMRYRRRLEVLYARDLSVPEKRQKKAMLFAGLQCDYERMRTHWQGFSGYDNWFRHPLNNAQIATVSVYNDLVPAFAAILQESNNNLGRFYGKCRQLADITSEERQLILKKYLTKPNLRSR